MQQTLFFIPERIAGLPVFGAGWVLLAWAIVSVGMLIVAYRRSGWSNETIGLLPVIVVIGAAIYWVLPMMVAPGLGLPIRGYGTMLLLGVTAGVLLAARRAKSEGLDPDLIYSLAFWMFVAGIAGARLFFVIQYWSDFQRDTLAATLVEVFKFTEGGLVVYGSLIGAMAAFGVFCLRHRLSALALGDMIGPAMLVGLGLGRLGCLMNGCCYGGVCETGPFSIVFPEFTSPRQQVTSPPYLDQLLHGQLHGIRLVEEPSGRVVVQRVERGSSAQRVGVKPGLEVRELNDRPVTGMADVRQVFAQRPLLISLITADGETFAWSLDRMPTHSLPVHPTQIYSAINAFLLAWMLWQLYPYRTRDGQVIAATIGLYAVTRFLLEIIRTDEAARFGTPLTISQLVSLIALVVIVGMFFYVQRQPRLVRSLER